MNILILRVNPDLIIGWTATSCKHLILLPVGRFI